MAKSGYVDSENLPKNSRGAIGHVKVIDRSKSVDEDYKIGGPITNPLPGRTPNDYMSKSQTSLVNTGRPSQNKYIRGK